MSIKHSYQIDKFPWDQMTNSEKSRFPFGTTELQIAMLRNGFVVLGKSLVVEGVVVFDVKTKERMHASLNSIMERKHHVVRERYRAFTDLELQESIIAWLNKHGPTAPSALHRMLIFVTKKSITKSQFQPMIKGLIERNIVRSRKVGNGHKIFLKAA